MLGAPKISTPADPPPPPPTVVSPAVSQTAAALQEQAKQAVGRQATILTSGTGVSTAPPVARRVLLGGS